MEIERNQILISFLETIEGISSKEYQRRVWIEGRGPECDDFDETVNWFFDDGRLVLKKYKDFGITDIQYLLLKKFFDEFEAFSDEHDWPPEFIDSPEWTKISEMAKEVLKAFHWKKSVENC
jgi:hypothetical protein